MNAAAQDQGEIIQCQSLKHPDIYIYLHGMGSKICTKTPHQSIWYSYISYIYTQTEKLYNNDTC